jgi:hypothetical protein
VKPQVESTRTQAGLILDERIAPFNRPVTLFRLRWTGLPHLGRRLANEATGVVDGSHPPVELATITATPELGSFSPALPFACSERDHIEATLHPKITDNSGHWWSNNAPAQQLPSARITGHPTARRSLTQKR